MARRPLTVLLISDGKPGHYRQSEGVVAAIAKLRPVRTIRAEVHRRRLVPARVLHWFLNSGTSSGLLLRLGYGLSPTLLPSADIIVSAGGETLAANAAGAKLLTATNIFCGRIRRAAPDLFKLIIVASPKLAESPNHLLALPPSALSVDRPTPVERPPRLVGVLIGGNSGTYRYAAHDWKQLTDFLCAAHASHGIRWMVATSRRSGSMVSDHLAAMAAEPSSGIVELTDYRTAGPVGINELLVRADAILCTDDSTTMISEAVAAHLPLVAVRPAIGALEPREKEYRQFLADSGWYRSLRLADLSPDSFLRAAAEIVPRTRNQLDDLAEAIKGRLPDLLEKD